MTRARLLAIVAVFAAAIVGAERLRSAMAAPRLTWIATARQFGPVGYRDPAGAISPDGKWIAYSEGRFLRVRLIGGGAGIEFPPGETQIRTLAWSADSTRIVADGMTTPAALGIYELQSGKRQPLTIRGAAPAGLRQLAFSPDGRRLAGIANGPGGNELRVIALESGDDVVTPVAARIAFPAWTPRGEVACIAVNGGRSRVTLPCGGAPLRAHPAADAFGPLAFAPDGSQAYVSLANSGGTVDLWSIPLGAGDARQLTSFSRDSYAPSVAADGSVVFKVQSYRTHVALAPSAGGETETLATFQSETPSWDPAGRRLGITYGTWRRVPDDANYPDIAQDVGIIGVNPGRPAVAPQVIVHNSDSEDQSLCWSPNGQWIMFHSHKAMSDDIWLRRAAGNAPARRISMLGRGAEVGWPRWSRDGKWVMFDGNDRTTGRSMIYVVGIDQNTGVETSPVKQLPVAGVDAPVFHSEWADAGETIVAIAKEGPGRHVIFTVARDGGPAKVVHRFSSEHDAPGLGVSPDGREAAFIAPARDGFFQVFRIGLNGGEPSQVTFDPSHKTQPAWSPDGRQIAFTVWLYEAQFWKLEVEPPR